MSAIASPTQESPSQSFALLDNAVVPLSSAHVWRRVGVLGGGQLGRMLAQAASRLNTPITVLDPTPQCPAGQITRQIVGSFTDRERILELARSVDIITVEIEHVDCDILDEVERTLRVPVRPSPQTIRVIQDKFAQKQHLAAAHVPVGPFMATPSLTDIERAGAEYGFPFILKSRRLAYDGRGNYVVKSKTDIAQAVSALGQSGKATFDLYAEQLIDFTAELAVMVARGVDGECAVYPAVVTNQLNNICHTVIAPAQIRGEYASLAEQFALKAIESLNGAGIFGVELFLLNNGRILVNEIAPRPHNSGHYTIEACICSQFEQHLRCILGLPLGQTSMIVAAATMINVLGTGNSPSDVERSWLPCKAALTVKGAAVHWYGKAGVSKGRKLGHITIVGDSAVTVHSLVKEWNNKLISMGADDISLRAATLQHDKQTALTSPMQPQPQPPITFGVADGVELNSFSPLVGIIMGSDSDLPTMRQAAAVLTEFDVPFELTIVSAHRTPNRMFQYAQSARQRGLRIIIAGAGGAAHLPGMVAALTPLPVIGVPIPLAHLDGVDSLYSIVQMPRGVPTATVAIGNATNAGLLAVRMLSIAVRQLGDRMEQYQKHIESEVLTKIDHLDQVGWKAYKPQ